MNGRSPESTDSRAKRVFLCTKARTGDEGQAPGPVPHLLLLNRLQVFQQIGIGAEDQGAIAIGGFFQSLQALHKGIK